MYSYIKFINHDYCWVFVCAGSELLTLSQTLYKSLVLKFPLKYLFCRGYWLHPVQCLQQIRLWHPNNSSTETLSLSLCNLRIFNVFCPSRIFNVFALPGVWTEPSERNQGSDLVIGILNQLFVSMLRLKTPSHNEDNLLLRINRKIVDYEILNKIWFIFICIPAFLIAIIVTQKIQL